jgi:hypothetical protein
MSDAEHEVKKWLETQGFPLEFLAADRFAKAGFAISQGEYFPDPRGETLRETDVVATLTRETDARLYRFAVVVECKWSRKHPWVIFTSRAARPTAAESIAYLLASPFAEAVLWFLAGNADIRRRHELELPPRAGFGGRQAFIEPGREDSFYRAIQSVVGAATALSRTSSDSAWPSNAVREFRVVVPTIVIDGLLFEAYLHSGTLEVAPLRSGLVSWRGFGARSQAVFVHIVTIDELPSFAEGQATYGENLPSGRVH